MRGEKVAAMSRISATAGSSPLARGKVICRHACGFIRRIIPACAGKSGLCEPRHERNRDHPRLRGEKPRRLAPLYREAGSSPLARGKEEVPAAEPTIAGIIPACAGKSRRFERRGKLDRDHPRLRGEKSRRTFNRMTGKGSSPLARGKDPNMGMRGSSFGIIPACAGKRTGDDDTSGHGTDHPRLRGEKMTRSIV